MSSNKRKLGDEATKFYAVRSGHQPGVYRTWQDCQENITQFRGAQFKSFTSQQDAEDYVAGKDPPSSSKPPVSKYYGVAVGHVPGVYEDWGEASEQIKDVKGPKYKKFNTRIEAEEFVKSGGKKSSAIPAAKGQVLGKASVSDGDGPATKKIKTRSSDSSGSCMAQNAKLLRVYTDGSSLGNGRLGAVAGVGVFFGEGDPRNVSERLEGDVQTNQRAELTAILRALEIAPQDWDIQILTDSNYAINCSTVWYKSWESNGWKTSVGSIVINKDLVISIRKLMNERATKGVKTEFSWIKGHSNDAGNEAADRLAVMGARRS